MPQQRDNGQQDGRHRHRQRHGGHGGIVRSMLGVLMEFVKLWGSMVKRCYRFAEPTQGVRSAASMPVTVLNVDRAIEMRISVDRRVRAHTNPGVRRFRATSTSPSLLPCRYHVLTSGGQGLIYSAVLMRLVWAQ